MFRAVFLRADGEPLPVTDPSQFCGLLNDPKGFLWVSLEHSTNEEMESILRGIFHFHPLAIEDCQSPGFQVSKIDDYGDYIFIISHAINPSQQDGSLDALELDVFLGKNYVVTCYTEATFTPIEKAWSLVGRDNRISKYGADSLCHTILDIVVDEYLPLIDQMENDVGWLEDSVMEKPNPATLHRLLTIKHNIMSLRRIIAPQREVMNRLSRDEFPHIIDSRSLIYFRDIYDHLVRIQDLSDTIRDIVSGALDIYLNSTSLRLNEIMKALTIVSTVFLPLSFITGAFGMNFVHIPGASSRIGFYIMSIVLVALGVLMLAYFKKRRWF